MNLGSRVWQGECGEFPQVRKLLFAYVIDEGFDKISMLKGSLFPVASLKFLRTKAPARFDWPRPCTDLYAPAL